MTVTNDNKTAAPVAATSSAATNQSSMLPSVNAPLLPELGTVTTGSQSDPMELTEREWETVTYWRQMPPASKAWMYYLLQQIYRVMEARGQITGDFLLDTLRGLLTTITPDVYGEGAWQEHLLDEVDNLRDMALPQLPTHLNSRMRHGGIEDWSGDRLGGLAAILFPDLANNPLNLEGLGHEFEEGLRAAYLFTKVRQSSSPRVSGAWSLLSAALIVAQEALTQGAATAGNEADNP